MAAIVEIGKSFAPEAKIQHLMADDMHEAIATVIGLDCVRVYLAEDNEQGGGVVGGLGVTIGPWIWNPALTEMSELFFWVRPGAPVTAALRLLRRAFTDAEKQKIDLATFVALPTSPVKVARVYARLGLKPLQHVYQKEIS